MKSLNISPGRMEIAPNLVQMIERVYTTRPWDMGMQNLQHHQNSYGSQNFSFQQIFWRYKFVFKTVVPR